MRVLNKKQMKLIDDWFDKNWTESSTFTAQDLPIELLEELERINDHETIWQNIDRYITDVVLEKMYG